MKYLAITSLFLAIAAGCGSFPSTEGLGREEIIDLADTHFQREQWSQASFLYTELMFRYPGDIQTDLFLYRSGIADRGMKLWADAEFYLYRVVNEYPGGPWADDAQLALAETMWMQRRDYRRDQTQVIRAREEMLRFFENYPSSTLKDRAEELFISINDHLARRSLFIGRFTPEGTRPMPPCSTSGRPGQLRRDHLQGCHPDCHGRSLCIHGKHVLRKDLL